MVMQAHATLIIQWGLCTVVYTPSRMLYETNKGFGFFVRSGFVRNLVSLPVPWVLQWLLCTVFYIPGILAERFGP